MKRLRRLRALALIPVLVFLGGCQLFGAAAGILNYLIPVAASVGGAVLIYYLTRDDD
jgi:hypothetical protein